MGVLVASAMVVVCGSVEELKQSKAAGLVEAQWREGATTGSEERALGHFFVARVFRLSQLT